MFGSVKYGGNPEILRPGDLKTEKQSHFRNRVEYYA